MNGQRLPGGQNPKSTANTKSYIEVFLSEPAKIGFSTPDLNDRFLRYLEVASRIRAENYDTEVVIMDAQNDQQMQYRQIESMLQDSGVQGLIVIPVDTNRMQPVTDMARQAGVPLVYLNRNPFANQEIPPNVYYVGSDPQDAGRMQGDFLGKNLVVGNLGILMGTPGLASTEGRTEGLKQELRENYPGIQVIAEDHADFLRQPAYHIAREWLQQFGYGLNAIAANNDEMALGAIRALQDAGRNDVMVLGIDGQIPGREAVRQGLLAATVFQDADEQGAMAVDLMDQLLHGQTPPQQMVMIPHILITDIQRNGATS